MSRFNFFYNIGFYFYADNKTDFFVIGFINIIVLNRFSQVKFTNLKYCFVLQNIEHIELSYKF